MKDDDLHAYVERDPICPRCWWWSVATSERTLTTGPSVDHYYTPRHRSRRRARKQAKNALARERYQRAVRADPQREEIR